MATATMTTKGQIMIPAAVRIALGLEAGEGDFSIDPPTSTQVAMNARFLVSLLLVLLLGACAIPLSTATGPIMIPGRLYSLQDGTALEFAVERSSGQGIMTAFNSVTGERFTGTYSAIITEGGGTEQSVATNFWGQVGPTVTKDTAATRAAGRGVLRGDKGTVISITMEIKPSYDPRINPSGFGDGVDNHGVKYQVQFG